MSRHTPSEKPMVRQRVLFKVHNVSLIEQGYWTGSLWRTIGGRDFPTSHIKCWWDMPTEEQLDRMEKS